MGASGFSRERGGFTRARRVAQYGILKGCWVTLRNRISPTFGGIAIEARGDPQRAIGSLHERMGHGG